MTRTDTMGESLRRLLTAPEFPDREVSRVAAAVHWIGLYLAGGAGIGVAIAHFATPDPWAGIGLCGVVVALGFTAIGFARHGAVLWASGVLVGMVWIVSTLAILYGGLESPAFSAFLIAIVLVGLLVGTKAAISVGAASAAAGALVGFLDHSGLLPRTVLEQTLLTRWVIEVTLFGAAGGVVAIYLNHIRDAQVRLEEALTRLLSGYVTICAACKQIEGQSERWTPVEQYIEERTEVQFTHGLCPICLEKAYAELDD